MLVTEIHTGQGGAEVFSIGNGCIAKCADREKCGESWPSHQREAAFYGFAQEKCLSFVPEVLCIRADDNEQLIVLREHAPLQREQVSSGLLDNVMATLAQIHATGLPAFLHDGAQAMTPAVFTEEEREACLAGWESVLAEHRDVFPLETIRQIPAHINAINQRSFSGLRCLVHGDFHSENLLRSEDEQILVCDWQGCGVGDPSGDLSFFISRLLSDGYPLDAKWLTERYCIHAAAAGLCISPEHVRTQMALANLNTSFRYWYMFLHGAEEGRVRDILSRMEADFRELLTQ